MFWSWKKVLNGDSELLKENLLNCVLLIPMGLLLPIMLDFNIRWWEGLLIETVVSAVIETYQLVFCRGLFEWDDMIHNGIGCMIGCVVMEVCRRYTNNN
ncbi:VanZ family protein [Enterocloster sp. OA13]|uniref:VanZ family protein n=1 Tax=Enterocloster TaxID=2719313 RepID=UPI000471BCC5|nr:VanZ family protein [Lachnoclostridium pacaense]MCH1951114.1 VanZ family protein [Enterocloster sp. OA13]